VQSEVEPVPDSGPGREKSHELVSKISDHLVPLLMSPNPRKDHMHGERVRSICWLRSRLKNQIAELAAHGSPAFRCPALQAHVELKSQDAIPLLIGRLDDHAVCMHATVTDPAREQDVHVSDEALHLLEQVTGQFLDRVSTNGHWATKPWKNWWAKQSPHASRAVPCAMYGPVQIVDCGLSWRTSREAMSA
jgi:hypothetical protein